MIRARSLIKHTLKASQYTDYPHGRKTGRAI